MRGINLTPSTRLRPNTGSLWPWVISLRSLHLSSEVPKNVRMRDAVLIKAASIDAAAEKFATRQRTLPWQGIAQGIERLETDRHRWYHQPMTRTEALATISAAVAHADGAKLAAITAAVTELSTLGHGSVLAVADVIRDMKAEQAPSRRLTVREHDLVAQSKADFADGRTYSTEEAFARIDAGLAARRAARARA
jgi:hypothetical protein